MALDPVTFRHRCCISIPGNPPDSTKKMPQASLIISQEAPVDDVRIKTGHPEGQAYGLKCTSCERNCVRGGLVAREPPIRIQLKCGKWSRIYSRLAADVVTFMAESRTFAGEGPSASFLLLLMR